MTTPHRLVFEKENFTPSVDKIETNQQPQSLQQAPKPLAQQSDLELKFTAQKLFSKLEDGETTQEQKSTAIAQLKEIANRFKKDPEGAFTLGYSEALAWFRSSDILPNDSDRIQRILKAQENQLKDLVDKSQIKDVQLLKAVAGERYQNIAKTLVETHSKTIADSIQIAANAFRRHQKMRDTVKADPEIQRYFKQKMDDYNSKTAKPHWSEQFAILQECYKMAIGQIPRPKPPKTKDQATNNSPDKKEVAPNLSPKAQAVLDGLNKFETFARNIKPPMLRNSVEGRWINTGTTMKLAQKWLTNPDSINEKEKNYLTRALNTSENSRANTLLVFSQIAFRISDPSIKPVIAQRIEKIKAEFFDSIKNAVSEKLSKEESRILYQNFKKTQLMVNILSSDGEGIAAKALEGRGNPSEKQLQAIFRLINSSPEVKNYLYSYLSEGEKKSAQSGEDLRLIYNKIIKKFERDTASGMPPLLALIKNNVVFISHVSAASGTLRNLASEAKYFASADTKKSDAKA